MIRNSPMHDAIDRALGECASVGVAYSGGRDSTALLHAALFSLTGVHRRVIAMHVHHGLSPHADEWLEHCEDTCLAWRTAGADLEFDFTHLEGSPSPGESVEAWARAGRYAALAAMAAQNKVSVVLLGHHQRDQAETFLLQALRGGGTRGLASMPAVSKRHGLTWLRPWLDQPREAVDEYVQAHGLKFVEDDSNADERFARNRLRQSVWPALTKAFPGAEVSITHAARWAQQAADALAELADIDLEHVSLKDRHALDLFRFGELSTARQANVLRAWLNRLEDQAPSLPLLERLRSQLGGTGPATWETGRGCLRRYRGVLSHETPVASSAPDLVPESLDEMLHVTGAGVWPVPGWHGELVVEDVASGDDAGRGVASSLLVSLRLTQRRGGESFQLAPNRPARSLKKQYQAGGVPPWQRRGPLVYAGDRLIYVPGLGIDARVFASPTEPQATLRWRDVIRTR